MKRNRKIGADPAEGALDPKMQAVLLTRQEGQQRITVEDIRKAATILQQYKDDKKNLEARLVNDELWYQMRHWEAIRGQKEKDSPTPSSAWLFNAILNKHADAMDNYPEPVVLPRERSDEESAKTLSSILPVIMEYNDFDQTYSDNWWEKLKHGTAVYGMFWNNNLENGLGDVDITRIDLLKIFWQSGITDIQDSKNLFITELYDTEDLEAQYPEYKGKFGSGVIDIEQYINGQNMHKEDKSLVVDWYYKVFAPNGQTMLHYVKFCNDVILYASENDPQYADVGFYAHGQYPVVFDTLFPEKDTPVGFGYVAICKDPQIYIDALSSNILENSMMATKKRYFISRSTNVNKEQFLNWNQPFIEVDGEIDDRRVREVNVSGVDGVYLSIMQQKIEEMKDTAANRDVNSGGTGSGVTAAAAIAALQEAGNKASRDMIAASYRSYSRISRMIIELIRQFYDESRSFRITGQMPGTYEFVSVNNDGLKDQPMGPDSQGIELFRKPVFDLKIKAQKRNPFSRVEQNEYAKELYHMGFFNPERAQEATGALDMMDFEGIDKVKETVAQGQTLLNICQQLTMQVQQCMEIMQASGIMPPMGAPSAEIGGEAPRGTTEGTSHAPTGNGMNGAIMEAQTPMTSYGTALAKRSKPSVNG